MIKQLQNIDIKLLRIFHTIVECEGFLPAQTKLNISQSSISTYMNQLETRLGVRLCERGHGVFRLTKDGEAVVEASNRLFDAMDTFCLDIAESQNRLIGELRIGLLDNIITHPNPRIRNALKDFNDHFPDVSPKIYVGHSVELEEQVLDGRLHLAIGVYPHYLSNLSYSSLFDEEQMLFCGENHPLFSKRNEDMSIEDLTDSKYVSWDNAEFMQNIDPAFSFKEHAASSSYEGVAFLILSGHYVGFLATHYANYWTEKNMMRAILPDLTRKKIPYNLVVHKTNFSHPLTSVFIEKLGCGQLLFDENHT